MGDALPAVPLGTGRTPVSVHMGSPGWGTGVGGRVCSILDDGTLKCWGNNVMHQDYYDTKYKGMLGYGSWYGGNNIGDDPGEMSSLPAVDVGSGRTVLDVALAGDSTCMLLDNGGIRCFGVSNGGNFGDPRNNGETTCDGAASWPPWSPGYLCMVQNSPDEPYADLSWGYPFPWAPPPPPQPPNALQEWTPARAVTAGSATCALFVTGRVTCWGEYSAYGYGDTRTRGHNRASLGNALPFVDLGLGLGEVASLASASGYVGGTCVVTAGGADAGGGRVKCFGRNHDGNLGRVPQGITPLGEDLPFLELGTGRTAQAVAMGARASSDWNGYHTAEAHTCALLDNGRVKCFGGNNFGQLGYGDTAARGDEAGEVSAGRCRSAGAGGRCRGLGRTGFRGGLRGGLTRALRRRWATRSRTSPWGRAARRRPFSPARARRASSTIPRRSSAGGTTKTGGWATAT